MEIFVNATLFPCPWINNEMTVQEVIVRLQPAVEKDGRALMEIQIDGEPFDPTEEEHLSSRSVGAVQKLDLLVQTHAEILQEAVQDGPEILLHLETKALEGANELRVGKVREAMERLVDVLDGLEWLTTILQHMEHAGKGLQENSLEQRRQDLIHRLDTQATSLHAAQEQQDWVGVADILEYEIQGLFREGAEIFRKVQD